MSLLRAGYVLSSVHESIHEHNDALADDLLDRTEQAIEGVLAYAGLSRAAINRVILVGSSTRIPYVKQLVERVMGQKPLSRIDPGNAVALGAAVQTAIVADTA